MTSNRPHNTNHQTTSHPPQPGRSRRVSRLALLLLVLAAGVLAAPAAASAGMFTVDSCSQPDGQPAPISGWSTGAIVGFGPDSGDYDNCASGGSLAAIVSSEAVEPAYEGPQWVFNAPAGETIEGGTITTTLSAPHGQVWIGTPTSTYDGADVLVNCQVGLPCGAKGTLTTSVPISHTGGTHLYESAVCVGAHEGDTSCPAYGSLDAAIYISKALIKLSDNATPTASGFTGSLLEPGARGSQELTFDASDSGSGVYAATVQIDGTTIYDATPDTNSGACVPLGEYESTLIFTSTQPCKQNESVDLPIDTTSLHDGKHTLKIILQDAARNTATVYNSTITTNNAPTETSTPSLTGQASVGGTLSASTGEWSAPAGAGAISYAYQWEACNPEGQACHAIAQATSASYTPTVNNTGDTLRVSVTAADNDGQATAQSFTSTPVPALPNTPGTPVPGVGSSAGVPNGTPASENATLHLDGPASMVRTFAKRAFKLTGTLTTTGQAIANATLDILEQIDGTNTLIPLAHTTTSPAGTFAVTIPPGPSRTIEIAYRASSTDTSPTATATVHETVHASVKLTINTHHTTPTGTITITGHVQGPIPPQGVLVELYVHYQGHWEPIRTPHTKPNGTLHLTYHFHNATGHYPFRLHIPTGQAGYPYTTATSNTIQITTT